MAVMQVGADGIVPKSAIIGWQIVDVAHQNRLAIFRVIDGARRLAVEAPKGLGGQVWGYSGRNLGLSNLVKLLRRELGKGLVGDSAAFAGCGVGRDSGRRIQ